MRWTWLVAFAAALVIAASSSPAQARSVHRCGNPSGWAGKLTGLGVGCHKARGVFNGIHCVGSDCEDIASGHWECFRHTVSRYKGRGNCHLGRKQVRWVVFE